MEEQKTRPKSLECWWFGFWSDMAVIAFVHAVHGFGLGIRGWDTNRGEDKHPIPIKARREENDLFNLQCIII